MKLFLSLVLLILFVSCGKYEKPFITFKSPEKRLTGVTWECIKVVDADGNESEVFDLLNFSINGADSTFIRISDDPVIMANVNQSDKDTVIFNWTWAYALGGGYNKQIIKQKVFPYKNYRVISLSKRILVLEDQSVGNLFYHYVPL